MVREIAGSSSEIVFIPRPTDDPTVRQPDITLAREVLGWEPKVHVKGGTRAHSRLVPRRARHRGRGADEALG